MIWRSVSFASLTLCVAGGLAAEPCVTDTFDTPFPSATNVVTRHADVPSPQFPGLWQEGSLDGYFYALYANGEATLKADQSSRDWELSVTCPESAQVCLIEGTGSPPEGAIGIAEQLGQCLRGQQAQREVVADVPCGLATIPEGDAGTTLQRLLLAAGADPGPIDGLPGKKTRDAVIEILGPPAGALDITALTEALNSFMCANIE